MFVEQFMTLQIWGSRSDFFLYKIICSKNKTFGDIGFLLKLFLTPKLLETYNH